jgi:similar to stage IV sporulation protein
MMRRLIAYLMGHVRIRVTGGQIARFLNLALEQGLHLWHIQRDDQEMRASLTIRDFRALRSVARGSRCRVRILRRTGFPFVLVRLRRRPALIAGAVACLAGLWWATSHIWIVRVTIVGPQNLDARAVAAVAGEAGLRPGVWKSRINLQAVQQHVQQRMGEVSWVVIRVQGTRAVLEVVEKAVQTVPDQAACVNLVARKAGVVEEIVPFQGEPVVKQGDIVKAGDLLVECSLKYWPGGRPLVLPGTQPPPRSATARTLVAQALVRVRITYRKYMEIPLVQEQMAATGRRHTQWVLNWNDRSIILRGEPEIPFARFREHRRTYTLPSWRNWQAPVELVIRQAEEVEVRQERLPESKALEQARAQLASQLRWVLGPSDKLLSPIRAEVVQRGREHVGVWVVAETLEEIAAPRPGTPIPMPPQPSGNHPVRP